jgi:hypothetical protein
MIQTVLFPMVNVSYFALVLSKVCAQCPVSTTTTTATTEHPLIAQSECGRGVLIVPWATFTCRLALAGHTPSTLQWLLWLFSRRQKSGLSRELTTSPPSAQTCFCNLIVFIILLLLRITFRACVVKNAFHFSIVSHILVYV